VDEGFDVDGIELAIICSGSGTPRQDLQRTGRAIRWKEGKLGVVINLYLKDTQDETWLRKRQAKSTGVQYVNSYQEISHLIGNSLFRNPHVNHE
jgi:superfamily II DNA or RNA helicase